MVESSPADAPTKNARRRLLLRGESAVASVGLALATILLAVMAATAWWSHYTQRAAMDSARADQVHAIGDLLSQSAEVMLAQDEASAVRRLVADAARSYDLARCQVVLCDGGVVASSDPSQVTVRRLPAAWPAGRLPAAAAGAADAVCAVYPLTVPGRGMAQLEIIASVPHPLSTIWQTQEGTAIIGTASFAALLFVYRWIRKRLRAVGAIHEALGAIAHGETTAAALLVSADLGPEAAAWNQLIAEGDRLKKQSVAERARVALDRRGQARGDLDAACDALSQGLIVVDGRNCVKYANGAAANFLRGKREEIVGADVTKYVQVQSVLEAIGEIANGSGRRRLAIDVERRDENGGGVLRFNVRPVRRNDSAAAMVIIEDITQQRVAEAARNNFVAQATHELRTPLTNIRLYVETAIEEGESDPAMRAKCLNVINGETRRLERIVGEMLSISEIEAGSFKLHQDDVRLDTLFRELREEYQHPAEEKRVDLTFKLPPKLPAIRGDKDKILLALHNLVGNALKYTPEGGKVQVEVKVSERSMTVEVADNGIGISPQDAEKIFDRFYRATDPRVSKITGTGLGLTIAREVIRLHGGDITVESQLNQGSTFIMSLPVMVEAA